MSVFPKLLIFPIFLLAGLFTYPPSIDVGDQPWQFKKEKEGIKVFTREYEGSNLKELKITLQIEATLSAVVAVLKDVEDYKQWVYRCSESKILETVSAHKAIEYFTVDFPWPMSDRDVVLSSVVEQHPVTKVVRAYTRSLPDRLSTKDDFIRIRDHQNEWVFTPIGDRLIEVVYTLRSDPAGSLPAWLINMAVDQGPVESMMGFRERLKAPRYQNIRLAQIVDFGE